MSRLILQTKPIAKKAYYCMASEFITESGNLRDYSFTFSEWRAILAARNNGYKIQKGQTYLRQCCENEGHLYTFIAIPQIHDICIKYDYYEI